MSMQVNWYGEKAKQKARRGAVRGLSLWAEHVLECANRIVPIEESTLTRSGVTSVDEQKLRAAVSYDTPYAVRQHEDLTAHHDPGRQAKYLETPLNSERKTGLALVEREVERELKS